MNPSDTNISFRGFNRRLSNKVLVLVDGRSVYSDYLGNTMWPLVDVALPDIQRIEVVRGPGSALYGANAFTGVVNIITKIGPEAGVRVFAQGGTHNTYQGGVSAGGKTGALSYRTTVAYDRADKWTKDVADDRVDMVPQFSQPNRSRENERADIAAVYDLGNKSQLQFGGGFDNVALEVYPIAALRTFASDGQTGFARAELDIGQTQLKAFWNALRFNSGPEYWPNGIPSLNSKIRSDMLDASMQTAFDFTAAGKHRVTVGAGYRYKTVDWSYLATVNGSTRYGEHHLNAFLQEEWSPSRAWSVIVSYRVDRHPLLASEHVTPGGLIHSPRGTILWEPKLDHVFRFTAGSAFRAPTFLESYTDLYAPIPNQPAVGVRFQGDPLLKPEEILQAELGYRGRFGSFQPEIVLYGERTKNLIVDSDLRTPASPQQAVDPITGQYLAGYAGFENDPTTYLGVGAEIGGKWTPADGVDISVNYSYEKMFGCQPGGGLQGCTSDTTAANQISSTIANTAQHKANLTALWRTKANFDFGIDVHFVSSVTWVEKSFAQVGNGQMGVLFNQYALDAYTLLNGRIGYRFNHDRFETGLSFYNLLESDDTAHREHPFGNRIGRRVMLSAMGTF
jgi:iron complex outermembrane receptor protein